MSDNFRVTKSFDFAADITKQLIALSTAIISLCVAFTDKIFSSVAAQSHSNWLLFSLISFVVSIISGVLTLMALAGHLGKPQIKNTRDVHHNQSQQQPLEKQLVQSQQVSSPSPIYEGNVRVFSIIQMLTFVIAIIMAMVYVWKASSVTNETPVELQNSGRCLRVIRVSDYTFENAHVIDTLCLDPKITQ